ncbi:hypothetical protein AGMMS50230_10190 [Spirochaetia bacterium]|nr:hypothetical protein AGMMS50230_10190 [Spirochaetia bacterium]
MDQFFEYHTGTVGIQPVTLIPNKIQTGTDGVICVDPEVSSIIIPFANKHGYDLVAESSCDITAGGSGISGIIVVQEGNTLKVTVEGTKALEDELTVRLKAKTKEEGRIVYEGTIKIAYINFDTSLKNIKINGTSVATFAPAKTSYTVSVPMELKLAAESTNSNALIDFSYLVNDQVVRTARETGQLAIDSMYPASGNSIIRLRVSAPHGAGQVREYTVVANQAGSILISGDYVFGPYFFGMTPKPNEITLGAFSDSACTMPIDLIDGGTVEDEKYTLLISSYFAGKTIYLRGKAILADGSTLNMVTHTLAVPPTGESVTYPITGLGEIKFVNAGRDRSSIGVEDEYSLYFDRTVPGLALEHIQYIYKYGSSEYFGTTSNLKDPSYNSGMYQYKMYVYTPLSGDSFVTVMMSVPGYQFFPATKTVY